MADKETVELAQQWLANQSREIEQKQQQVELESQKDRNEFEFAKMALKAESENLEKSRDPRESSRPPTRFSQPSSFCWYSDSWDTRCIPDMTMSPSKSSRRLCGWREAEPEGMLLGLKKLVGPTGRVSFPACIGIPFPERLSFDKPPVALTLPRGYPMEKGPGGRVAQLVEQVTLNH